MDALAVQHSSQQTNSSTPGSHVLLPDNDDRRDPYLLPIIFPPNSIDSTSPAPLPSMRHNGLASSASHPRITDDWDASAQSQTSTSSASSLFTCSSAPLLGSEARSSVLLGDTRATRDMEGVAIPDSTAVGGAFSPRHGVVVHPSTQPITKCVPELTAAEKGPETEEVQSCMTLSSTASSPEAFPLTEAAPPPPQQPWVLLSSSSNEGHYGQHKDDEVAQLLSCSSSVPSLPTVLTSSAMFGGTAVDEPSSLSPAPFKPSAATATAMVVCRTRALSDAEQPDVQRDVHARLYMPLGSDFTGGFTDRTAAPPPTSTRDAQHRCSLPSSEERAPLLDGMGSNDKEAVETAPAAPPATTTNTAAEPALSSEQRYAFHVTVKEHHSAFITGGAGTGKSHLLRTIIRALPASSTFITATTGIASLNLSGSTLHSFAGCGIPNRSSTRDSLLSSVLSKQRCVRSWRICRVLIIDEVSMLEPSFFGLIDYIARHVRNRPHEPFGGIQLILSGDFLQLPPVSRERRDSSPQFCFETESWWKVNPTVCLLSTPFRQRNLRFFAILNEMRFGELQPDSVELLYSMDTTERVHFVRRTDVTASLKMGSGDGPSVVRVGHKRGADVSAEAVARGAATCKTEVSSRSIQQTRLELVNGAGRAIDAPFDGYTILRATRAEVDAENQKYYHQLTTEEFVYRGFHTGRGAFPDGALAKVVQLRKGCRVMLIKNFDSRLGLVNGSTGTVTDFVSFAGGYYFKAQGICADDARSICVGRGNDMDQRHTMLPVVAFDLRRADGTVTSRELVVEPQEWKEMLGSREVARSVQIPLILAYAITIHKSQGMSLTQVDIDFQNVFESGQSYVALSRCTDMAYVRLHGFDAHRVSTNATALAYYKALALQQERLRWRRTHVPQVVAAEEAVEAFSCTPYRYALPSEAQTLARPRREDRTTGFISTSNTISSTSSSTSSSCDSSSDRAGLQPRDLDDEDVVPKSEGRRERHGGNDGEGCTRRGCEKLHRRWDRGGCAWTDNHREPHMRAYAHDGLGEEPNDSSDNGGDGMNETMRLDKLRRRITPLLAMAAMVKHLVTRQAMPLHCVCNSRIVVDMHALFQLVTGPESSAAFDVLFAEHDNMMRVPLCVHTLVTEAASYRSCSESLNPLTPPHLPVASSNSRLGDALVGYNAFRVDSGGAKYESADAPLLAASYVAAEALAVMERAKQDFILDVQRPEQTCALPEPNPSWRRFTEVLPLLCRRAVEAQVNGGARLTAANEADDTCDEVDFILNRDPREALHHRAILEYTMYLQATFGQGVVICTDSVLLAAYAFAWGLRVVSIDYLCSRNSGGDGVVA
ncbi:DNA repair and recombination helicase protein PIF7, putative [Leishmania panamensis]|uniref:ATP-dependent DNA helicase n=1 Tax=Leishmania panamensis TaxID=5679 RepID=A0A088RIR0_LEIPA|nr:DNA repair and recombination helicase protein PIF7, putative [Leishmania panamensis]AIN95793.1 DNA repair and recombination helicase protein PIF7, putative [Leishmania panamensis]